MCCYYSAILIIQLFWRRKIGRLFLSRRNISGWGRGPNQNVFMSLIPYAEIIACCYHLSGGHYRKSFSYGSGRRKYLQMYTFETAQEKIDMAWMGSKLSVNWGYKQFCVGKLLRTKIFGNFFSRIFKKWKSQWCKTQ